jgi:hypothetical protein
MNTDSIKGQMRCIQTLTVQFEAPLLETSKFLYFSGSCIPINPKLLCIFPPQFLVAFNRFQCKKLSIKFSTRNSEYFIYILQQLPSKRRTHFNFSRAMPTLSLRTGMLWGRDRFIPQYLF